MASNPKLDLAQMALQIAKKRGASDAAAIVKERRDRDLTVRDGRLEKISEATSRTLDMRLFVDGRYSVCSTSDLRQAALEAFLDNAVSLTRTLAKDPFRALPDPALYQANGKASPEIADPKAESMSPDELRRIAESIEHAARQSPGNQHILSVTAFAGSMTRETTQAHSNGFEGTYRDTRFSISAEVSVKDEDSRRPAEDDYADARFFSELPEASLIGRRAAERAIARRGAKKIQSGLLPIIVQNRAGGRLVGYLMRALSGAALQQKRSFLDGFVGKAFGHDNLDLTDNPLLARALGSRPFDGEGIASKRLPIFEGGVLKSYYIDTYYGKKLGMRETSGAASNIEWKLGSKGEAELIASIEKGLLITGFIGGNSNDTTGDFSVGAQGFAIRGGKLAEPIAEANVSGSHLELWKRLASVGNDPFLSSTIRPPTLVFDGVSVAGT